MRPTMRLALLLIVLFTAALRSSAQDEPGSTPLNAMVTVRVKDLDETLWTKVNARIAKETNMNVEYSCINTGIIVLRLQHVTATEKADVITIVKRVLHEAGVKGTIEFLDVQVRTGPDNRCHLRPFRKGTTVHSPSCSAMDPALRVCGPVA